MFRRGRALARRRLVRPRVLRRLFRSSPPFRRYISFARAVFKEDVAGEDTGSEKRPRRVFT